MTKVHETHSGGEDAAEPAGETPAFRDLVGTTRKYVIPLLEHLDDQGITQRVENKRILRKRARDAFMEGTRIVIFGHNVGTNAPRAGKSKAPTAEPSAAST
jgi:hypothetical protein